MGEELGVRVYGAEQDRSSGGEQRAAGGEQVERIVALGQALSDPPSGGGCSG